MLLKREIRKICANLGILNYTINDDLSIDVDGDVNINSNYLEIIPIQFRKVNGGFYCQNNFLRSLKGSPIECKIFDCSWNLLTTLEYSPKKVKDFKFYGNELESLMYIPEIEDIVVTRFKYGFTLDDYYNEIERRNRDIKFKKILKSND